MKVRTAKRLAVAEVAVVAFVLLTSASMVAGACVARLAGLTGHTALWVILGVGVPMMAAGSAGLVWTYERTVLPWLEMDGTSNEDQETLKP